MKNKKVLRFVESLILLPISLGATGQVAPAPMNMVPTPQAVLSQKLNNTADAIFAVNTKEDDSEAAAEKVLADKAAAVDAYFEAHDMPLEGTGMKMVTEAEKNGLDWRLVAAISVRESTGGKHDCNRVDNNPFGWGSCKIGFKSVDDAIATIARNLGGNNPKTAYHYDNKTTLQILNAYNPPSVVPKYASQVMSIMNAIGAADTTPTDNA